jgi:hypothetical protein
MLVLFVQINIKLIEINNFKMNLCILILIINDKWLKQAFINGSNHFISENEGGNDRNKHFEADQIIFCEYKWIMTNLRIFNWIWSFDFWWTT